MPVKPSQCIWEWWFRLMFFMTQAWGQRHKKRYQGKTRVTVHKVLLCARHCSRHCTPTHLILTTTQEGGLLTHALQNPAAPTEQGCPRLHPTLPPRVRKNPKGLRGRATVGKPKLRGSSLRKRRRCAPEGPEKELRSLIWREHGMRWPAGNHVAERGGGGPTSRFQRQITATLILLVRTDHFFTKHRTLVIFPYQLSAKLRS